MKKKEKRLFNFDIYFTHCNMNSAITHAKRTIAYQPRDNILFSPINNPKNDNPRRIIGRGRNYFGPYFVYRFFNYLTPIFDTIGDNEFDKTGKWECL